MEMLPQADPKSLRQPQGIRKSDVLLIFKRTAISVTARQADQVHAPKHIWRRNEGERVWSRKCDPTTGGKAAL